MSKKALGLAFFKKELILPSMEFIQSILPWIQIALSVLVTATVLMQQSDAGLGGAFGGDDSTGTIHRTRRGFERTLFISSIVFGVLFVASTLLAALI